MLDQCAHGASPRTKDADVYTGAHRRPGQSASSPMNRGGNRRWAGRLIPRRDVLFADGLGPAPGRQGMRQKEERPTMKTHEDISPWPRGRWGYAPGAAHREYGPFAEDAPLPEPGPVGHGDRLDRPADVRQMGRPHRSAWAEMAGLDQGENFPQQTQGARLGSA